MLKTKAGQSAPTWPPQTQTQSHNITKEKGKSIRGSNGGSGGEGEYSTVGGGELGRRILNVVKRWEIDVIYRVSKPRRFSVWHMFKTTSFRFPPTAQCRRFHYPNTKPLLSKPSSLLGPEKRKGKEREKWRRERNTWPWWELELFWALFLQSYFLSFFRGESLSVSVSLPFSILTLFFPLVLTIRSHSIWLPRKRRKREPNLLSPKRLKRKI